MSLLDLLNGLVAQLADAQAAADALAKAKYDEGFAAGVASVQTGFTQADIDAAVKAAVDPLNAQVALLQASVDGIPAQLEAAKVAVKSAVLDLVKSEELDLEGKLSAL